MSRKRKLLIMLPAYVLFAPAAALAFCFEPSSNAYEPSFSGSAPSTMSIFGKPSVPYCMSSFSYSREHTCSKWEIDRYFDEVNDYINDLNNYLDEVNGFAEEAREYAEEAINFANDIQEFATNAHDYAQCEAEDVRTQHE